MMPEPHTADAETVANARTALLHFRHYDVPGSLADLHDALHPTQLIPKPQEHP